MKDQTVEPQGLRRRNWLLGVANASIGLQGIVLYLLGAGWEILVVGLIFLLLIPVEVTDRVENRGVSAVVAGWLIAFGGSGCFLKVSTTCFVIVLCSNLLVLAACIAILYKPWISLRQWKKQRNRERRRAQRMAERKKQ